MMPREKKYIFFSPSHTNFSYTKIVLYEISTLQLIVNLFRQKNAAVVNSAIGAPGDKHENIGKKTQIKIVADYPPKYSIYYTHICVPSHKDIHNTNTYSDKT